MNLKHGFAAVLALLWGSASIAPAVAQSTKVILFQNQAPISGVTMIAKAKGFFEKRGLDVDIRNVTLGKLGLDAVLGGSAQFATVAETPAMRAALANQPIAIVATMQTSDNDTKVLARADRGIKTLKDLKGKRVATAIGTSGEFFMVSALQANGLTTNDIKLVNLRPQDMATALDRGDIDAYFIWEPHIFNGRKLMGNKAHFLSAKGLYFETFNILSMRDYVQKNQDTVRKLLLALIDAEGFINQNPDESLKLIAEGSGMDVATLAGIRSDFHYRVELNPHLMDMLRKQAQWDISTGKPAAVANVEQTLKQLVMPDILRSIAKDRVVGY